MNSIEAMAAALRRGECSPRELAEDCLARIGERNELVNAFVTVTEEMALAAAKRAEERISQGDSSLLLGIPCALKDNLTVAGVPATAASPMLEGFVPPESSAAWERLETAGTLLLGKTNMDEFAMGSFSEASSFGPVRNPWDTDRSAGGSSGGSAAAVADGQTLYALGSDTGGSVRVPAAFSGVVGLKPTYGRISRRGLIAYASSFDTVGVLTRTVRDAAIVLDALAGPDEGDMSALARTDTLEDWLTAAKRGVRGLRIGIPSDLYETESGIGAILVRTAESLFREGARLKPVRLPRRRDCRSAYGVLTAAEASSNLARYDGIRYGRSGEGAAYTEEIRNARSGFGEEVKRRLLFGGEVLSRQGREEYYEEALRLRGALAEAFLLQFREVDVILTPTTPSVACPLGSTPADVDDFCLLPSLAGSPAITVPLGRVGGLPVGLQVMAPPLRETVLFTVAAALEEVAANG